MTGRGEDGRHVMTAGVRKKQKKQRPQAVDKSSRSPWTSEKPLSRSCRIPNGAHTFSFPPKCPFLPLQLQAVGRNFPPCLTLGLALSQRQIVTRASFHHRPQTIYDRRRVRLRYTELALSRHILLTHSPLAGHGCDQEEGCQPRPSGARRTIPLRRL